MLKDDRTFMQNTEDNKCFLWTALTQFYREERNKTRVFKYVPYSIVLNMSGIDFPVKMNDISKFKRKTITF